MSQLTQHAMTRMQQRGIKELTLQHLLQHGAKTHDGRGCQIVYFNKQSRKRLQKSFCNEAFKQLEKQMDAYAVISEFGDVVTVGHRTKRINRY